MLPALTVILPLLLSGRPAGALPPEAAGPAQVRRAAERELAARFPEDAYRLEIRVKRVAGPFDEAASLRVVFPAQEHVPRGLVRVTVTASGEEAHRRREGWALLYVAHFDSVLVTRTHLHVDEGVAPSDAAVAWIETTAFRGEPLRPVDWRRLAGTGTAFAARSVREGQVLRRDDLRGAYAAEAGDTVVMRYRRAGITFDLTCKARQSGHVGDEIRLYADDTGRTYRARLTGTGTAEWLETL